MYCVPAEHHIVLKASAARKWLCTTSTAAPPRKHEKTRRAIPSAFFLFLSAYRRALFTIGNKMQTVMLFFPLFQSLYGQVCMNSLFYHALSAAFATRPLSRKKKKTMMAFVPLQQEARRASPCFTSKVLFFFFLFLSHFPPSAVGNSFCAVISGSVSSCNVLDKRWERKNNYHFCSRITPHCRQRLRLRLCQRQRPKFPPRPPASCTSRPACVPPIRR